MKDQVEEFTRNELKKGLAKCSPAQQKIFKRMYSHQNLNLDIDNVVDNMIYENLDRALSQVDNTINKGD